MAPPAFGAGGGSISNDAPTVDSLGNGGLVRAVGDTEVLMGTAHDKNGEKDITGLQIGTTDDLVAAVTVAVDGGALPTVKPGSFTGGWKVWNSDGAKDGIISFEYQFPYSDAGTYHWEANVKDENAYAPAGARVFDIDVTARIDFDADPYSGAGTLLTDVRWGAWTALPGATAVPATGRNYLRIVNTGTQADQAFTVDFTEGVFTGVTDGTETIPIDGNVQFAWWEDTSPETSSPEEEGSNYEFSPAADGSVAPQFGGLNNVVYVTYVLDIPATILDQAYEAHFTIDA